MNIVAFGASTNSQSINKKFASWAATQIEGASVEILDLNEFEMPIYSIDRQNANGIPDPAYAFRQKLEEADGIIISLAEHNGSYTAAFKNIFDWMSRIEKPIWMNKPILLLSTAPGARGGQNVMSVATRTFPFQGAQVSGSFSLPRFKSNFDENHGITDPKLLNQFKDELEEFTRTLSKAVV